jgi:hypothetical protein
LLQLAQAVFVHFGLGRVVNLIFQEKNQILRECPKQRVSLQT